MNRDAIIFCFVESLADVENRHYTDDQLYNTQPEWFELAWELAKNNNFRVLSGYNIIEEIYLDVSNTLKPWLNIEKIRSLPYVINEIR